ncbi:Beta-lactamase class penicillin binding protein [Mycena sanguinolenta]|uniref:Beta-lactamase class penicillin binding protein n=1 Tax=Mycena sanguinolenta TaxID=230812 RepID=A0A8H7CT59_9AGAR|nr:Beta-lactamase class penicillin binding protein [Mycena sanguinolenta]
MTLLRAFKFLVFLSLAVARAAQGIHDPYLQQQFPITGGPASPPILTARLDSTITNILQTFKTPGGVGVAVVRKTDQGAWQLESKGYGNATTYGDKVTPETLFAIGSNSKLFDVLATGLLISNETLIPRISWNSKVASIIPEWKLMDPVATRESTIVDLMSHRTGLPRHDFMGPLDMSPADVISRLQYLRPSAGFREQTQYNNHMYTVLSHLPSALLNTTYEKYVHDNIFNPLGMDATTYLFADAVRTGNLADGFLREGANLTDDPFSQGTVHAIPYWDQSAKGHGKSLHFFLVYVEGFIWFPVISGAGGVISSAQDMAIWLQMLLMEGKNQSNKTVIPVEVIRKAATGVTVYTPVAAYPELSPVVYGGGQMRGTYRGYEMIEHGGATVGFRSQVTRFPSQNFGVAVMSNDDDLGNAIMESVKYRIIDEIFGLEPIDWPARHFNRYRVKWAQAVPPPPISRAKDAEPPAVPYTALAGLYTHPAYGSLDFCLFWENTTTGNACAALAGDIAADLPGVVESEIPTLIARWDTIVTNYIRLAHYASNMFNLTALRSYPTQIPDEVWVRKMEDLRAEFEVKGNEIGFATIDLWGSGNDVEPPQGNTVEERAEIWFTKMS